MRKILLILLLMLLCSVFVFVRIRISGDSLSPLLQSGDVVWGMKVFSENQLRKDHLAVFSLERSDQLYVKHLFALPGESIIVSCTEDIHCVLQRKDGISISLVVSSVFLGDIAAWSREGVFLAPEGKCLVFGYSPYSYDSREFGLLSCNKIFVQSLVYYEPLK